MVTVRVLLWSLPPILHEILTDLVEAQADMELVSTPPGATDLATAAVIAKPRVIILGLDQGETPDESREVLHRMPDTKLLAIEASGRRAWLYELRPHQVLIGEISPSGLLDTIRQAAASEVG